MGSAHVCAFVRTDPRRPDSHTVHLVNVAYNSVFLGEICVRLRRLGTARRTCTARTPRAPPLVRGQMVRLGRRR
jgi:hypothetical protein